MSVVRTVDLSGAAPAAAPRVTVSITVAPGPRPPDLTACITYAGPRAEGRLAWTFDSSVDVEVPGQALFCDVGVHTDNFARQLVTEIGSLEGKQGIYDTLKGKGKMIAKNIPGPFWDLIRKAAVKTAPNPPRD